MTKSEIKPLTGIRAVAAFAVVLFHLRTQLEESFPRLTHFIEPLVSQGYLGVDLFFILSGFIIHYTYSERLTAFSRSGYGEYLWMRLARIWPVHMTILLLYALVFIIAWTRGGHPTHQDLYSLPSFLLNVILVHAWSIPIVVSWNAPAWSISCEWFVYLLFPLFLMAQMEKRRPIILLLYVGITLIGTSALCQYLHADGDAAYGLIRVIGEFFGGCGLGLIYRLNFAGNLPWRLCLFLAISVIVAISCFAVPLLGWNGYWSVPFLGILVLGLAHDRGFIAHFLSMKFMLFGGYISYSIYMIHLPCLIIADHLKQSLHLSTPLTVLISLLFIVAAATLMYRLVEEPCRKAMRKAYPQHKQQPYPVI